MDPALLAGDERPWPSLSLGVFEGPLDLLLHLVRDNQVSIWDIPIARICDQYHAALKAMEQLDLEIAGEYLVYAAWLLLIKSRMLLPRHSDGAEDDPRRELVERLVEYEKVKRAAAELAGIEEVRRGMVAARAVAMVAPPEDEFEFEDLDVLAVAQAFRDVLERHRREHPAAIELEPIRFSVRDKILELYEMIRSQRSFPLLSHLLTRPDRIESVTLLVAALELIRLGTAKVHQRRPFAEVYLTPTGEILHVEALADA